MRTFDPLLAVHLSDGALPPAVLVAGAGGAFLLLWLGLYRVREPDIPRIGLLTAALFVASQIHIPLGIGTVHLLLNGIAGILLRRHVGVATFVALVFQVFLFGHGGITTLGTNAVIIALPALLGSFVFQRLFARFPNRTFRIGAFIGFLVSTSTVCLNALVVWLGLELNSPAVAATILIAHIPVIAVETIITGIVASYLVKVKPEWLTR